MDEGVLIGALIGEAISVFMAWLLYRALIRIPQEYHTIPTYFPWLGCIPFAGIVFNWIIIPFKLPESLRLYFADHPNDALQWNEDFGKKSGLNWMGFGTASFIPLVNILTVIPGIVFMVKYLIHLNKLTNTIPLSEIQNQIVKPKQFQFKTPVISRPYSPKDKYEQLANLKKLKDDDVLTDEEFAVEKKKLLDT